MTEKTEISVKCKFLQYFASFIKSRVTPEGVVSIHVTHDDERFWKFRYERFYIFRTNVLVRGKIYRTESGGFGERNSDGNRMEFGFNRNLSLGDTIIC